MARKIRLCALLLILLLLGGCLTANTDIPLEESSSRRPPESSGAESSTAPSSAAEPAKGTPVPAAASQPEPTAEPTPAFTPYQAPELATARFDPSAASGENGVLIDLSGVSKGYVAVSAVGEARMKFRVEMGEQVYNYDLPSDGTPTVYPLQCGDGSYIFRALTNTVGSKYALAYSAEAAVRMEDEFQPFLRPSQYVDYDADSKCVQLAAELASQQPDALGVVKAVVEYICGNVTYDKEKAATVSKGYLPSPDETLASGKGICFDYASLAAAMLRSQGIPTKMIFGNVEPDGLYHAWNMFYTEESGWVTLDYQVDEGTWSRLDLTFSANGADQEFIGDGTHYTDVYFY